MGGGAEMQHIGEGIFFSHQILTIYIYIHPLKKKLVYKELATPFVVCVHTELSTYFGIQQMKKYQVCLNLE